MAVAIGWAIVAINVSPISESLAQDDAMTIGASDVEQLREKLAAKDAVIDQLMRRLEELEQRVNRIESGAIGMRESEPALAASPVAEPAQDLVTQAATEQLSASNSREQDRMIRSAFERTLIDRGGLLLPPGVFDIEPSISYVHSSWENVVIDGFTILPVLVIGDIKSERITRNLSLLNVTARFGLPWNMQAEIRIPYGHLQLRSHSVDGKEVHLRDNGMGDIEVALSKQLNQSDGRWPDLMASLAWKSHSGNDPFRAAEGDIFVGSGYESAKLSFTAVKVVDPVVYFAGLNYTYNDKTTQEIGTLNPGDNWGFNLGMAVALNLNNSLSFAYDQQFTKRSELDGQAIPGSYATTGVFSIGTALSFSDRTTVDVTLGIGVTEDSPDLLFSVSVPFRGEF